MARDHESCRKTHERKLLIETVLDLVLNIDRLTEPSLGNVWGRSWITIEITSESKLFLIFFLQNDAYFLNYKMRSRKCAILLQKNARENILIMHLLCILVHDCNIRRLKKIAIKYIAYNYRSFSVLLHSI